MLLSSSCSASPCLIHPVSPHSNHPAFAHSLLPRLIHPVSPQSHHPASTHSLLPRLTHPACPHSHQFASALLPLPCTSLPPCDSASAHPSFPCLHLCSASKAPSLGGAGLLRAPRPRGVLGWARQGLRQSSRFLAAAADWTLDTGALPEWAASRSILIHTNPAVTKKQGVKALGHTTLTQRGDKAWDSCGLPLVPGGGKRWEAARDTGSSGGTGGLLSSGSTGWAMSGGEGKDSYGCPAAKPAGRWKEGALSFWNLRDLLLQLHASNEKAASTLPCTVHVLPRLLSGAQHALAHRVAVVLSGLLGVTHAQRGHYVMRCAQPPRMRAPCTGHSPAEGSKEARIADCASSCGAPPHVGATCRTSALHSVGRGARDSPVISHVCDTAWRVADQDPHSHACNPVGKGDGWSGCSDVAASGRKMYRCVGCSQGMHSFTRVAFSFFENLTPQQVLSLIPTKGREGQT